MNKYQEQQKALEADIQEMEVCILRLQNSIARNKVVIAELGIHDRTMAALKHTVKLDKAEPPQPIHPGTIPDMLDAVLPSLPLTFHYQDAIAACIKQWPTASTVKIRTGIYPAIINLKKAGAIVGDGNGGMIYKGAHRS